MRRKSMQASWWYNRRTQKRTRHPRDHHTNRSYGAYISAARLILNGRALFTSLLVANLVCYEGTWFSNNLQGRERKQRLSVKSSQLKSGQVRSNQVKSPKAKSRWLVISWFHFTDPKESMCSEKDDLSHAGSTSFTWYEYLFLNVHIYILHDKMLKFSKLPLFSRAYEMWTKTSWTIFLSPKDKRAC